MGSLKKLYGWYPDGSAWIPIKVDSNGKVVISNLAVTFIDVTVFTNSWINYGGIYRVAGYCKDSFGFVHLQGFIKSGVNALSAFTLPVGYRPSVEVYLASASATRIGTLIIGTNGTVAPQGEYSSTWFTLDGLLFYVG